MAKYNYLMVFMLLLTCFPVLQGAPQTLKQTAAYIQTQSSDHRSILPQKQIEDTDNQHKQSQPNVTFSTDVNFVKYVEFSGQYHSQINSKLFDYLESREGLLQSIFYENSEWSQDPITDFNALALELFDPVYHDRDYVIIALHLQNRTGEGQWVGVNSEAEFQSVWKGRSMEEKTIDQVNFTVKIKNVQSQDLDSIQVQVKVSGQNFKFHTLLTYTNEKWSIIGYCLYTTFVVASQVLFISRVINKIDNDAPHLANKISLTTVSMCNIMDFYATIIHIQYIITSSSYYLFYIFPSTAYIFLFIIYDMKLLFLVWRSHTLREINNPQDLRKNLTVFYIKFYLGLFLYLAFIYFFIFDEWFIILQNLIFVPQIVRNVRMGNNPGFQPFYILGYLGMRYFIPLYQRACPDNHFNLMPMTGVVITIGILYGIQITILLLQFIKGPRFFVPKIFQPDYFDYRAKIKYNEDTKQLDCSICLLNFFELTSQEDNIQNSSTDYSLNKPMFEQKSVMKTPCNHYFHRDCLTNWADVKLECPTCRSPLPPL